MAYACSKGNLPASPRLGVVSISGGINVLTADAAMRMGLTLPEMPAAAQAQILGLIPFGCALNPIDTTAQFINDPSLVRKLLDILLEQGGVDSVIVYLQTLGRAPHMFKPFGEALLQARERHPGKLFVLCGGFAPELLAELEGRGFLIFEDPMRCARAVAGLWHFSRVFGQGDRG
jgi:acyl-CoA synthetase (NDP forming)